MTFHLSDILAKKNFDEPTEIQQIKDFVHEAVGVTPRVAVTQQYYIITVSSAAAAGVLRTKIRALRMDSPKRMVIRIN